MYPIRGVVFLLTTPELLQLVLRFLGTVTVASFISTVLCFAVLWQPHMRFLGWLLGISWFTKFTATILLMFESALPIALIFKRRLKKLGKQLFDRTLQIKLGAAAPMGSTSHEGALAALQQSKPQPCLAPVQPQDHQALTRMVTKHRQDEATAQQGRSLVGAAVSMAVRLLFQPQANESILVRKARDVVTLGITALVPGAALLLPLVVYRDSASEVGDLMARYWEAKGVDDGDAQQLLAQQHMNELRGFGLVVTALSYIPVLNWALSLSNHVAAALYAAHLEAKGARLMKWS